MKSRLSPSQASSEAEKVLDFNFLPKQKLAKDISEKHTFTLYGGARGPGKSRWLRWTLLFYLLKWFKEGHRNVRVMLACETYPALQDRQMSKIVVEFPAWLGELRSDKAEGLGFFLKPEFGAGAILLRNLDDPEKYQSAEFAALGIDELTKNDFHMFEVLRGSLRWPGISHRPFLGATNPGGIGHLWVKALFVDRDYSAFPQLKKRANEFAFVKALPKDNPYLDDAYWAELNSLSDALRRAWVDGDWNVFAGQAFTEWNEYMHVVDPFAIPQHYIRSTGTDMGYAKPWCTLWGAIDPDMGRRFIYREAYGTGATDKRQAKIIMELSKGEVFKVQFADPSAWARKNVRGIVTSTADEYRAEGVVLMPGDNNRLGGKRKVHSALADLPDGKPGLQVFRTCTNLIRTLPALPYDAIKVEDVDTDAEDHAYDALRYLLSDYSDKKPKPEELDEETKAWIRQQAALAKRFG